mmetsp:Transcript_30473/g.71218  ORF Transcript_30473/g.71218 Transcript_30473/m.71218 type:complete len:233 (-) Transcript_30473:564-1262(-)
MRHSTSFASFLGSMARSHTAFDSRRGWCKSRPIMRRACNPILASTTLSIMSCRIDLRSLVISGWKVVEPPGWSLTRLTSPSCESAIRRSLTDSQDSSKLLPASCCDPDPFSCSSTCSTVTECILFTKAVERTALSNRWVSAPLSGPALSDTSCFIASPRRSHANASAPSLHKTPFALIPPSGTQISSIESPAYTEPPSFLRAFETFLSPGVEGAPRLLPLPANFDDPALVAE